MKAILNRKHSGILLQMALALEGRALQAANGEIGTLEALSFDDVNWVIRYLIVDTGDWLRGRRVLVPPLAVDVTSVNEPILNVELTRDQIEGSPAFDTTRPILRAYEVRYYAYYSWPAYWETDPLAGHPLSQVPASPELVTGDTASSRQQYNHLHPGKDLRGCEVVASDGATGKIRDMVVDPRYWLLRYLRIETGAGTPAKEVLLSPAWIKQVNWMARSVSVDLDRAAIVRAPRFDPSRGISREFEAQLLEHYGHPAGS